MRRFLFLFLLHCVVSALSSNCDGTNFRNVIKGQDDDYLVYGLTQDCQMFFIRPSQLSLLTNIRVDRRHSFCYANLVQLHVKSHDTLLVTFKQANNRICTLEVHIPSISMLFGDHLFRYSLLNSLPYASCSHTTDFSFQLEPDLSFMDPLYKDVIYFVDALSVGDKWKVHQFLLKDTGNLNMMNNLTIPNSYSRDAPASEFILSIDTQKDKIFRRNRFDNIVDYQCSLEMLFRQDEVKVKKFEMPSRGYGTLINGQAVEEELMVYVETDRTTDPSTTRLNILNINKPNEVHCLVSTAFSYDIGLIRESTLNRLKDDPLPAFGSKKVVTTQSQRSSTTTAKPKPTRVETTPPKPKGSYSPSKAFFSYEMSVTTEETMRNDDGGEEVEENEIRDEREEDGEEEELNEIIKELKYDNEEDIGMMKAVREVNTSAISTDDGMHNNTTSDQAAVQSFSPIYSCILSFFLVLSFNICRF